jgi:hypothetical protein
MFFSILLPNHFLENAFEWMLPGVDLTPGVGTAVAARSNDANAPTER